MNTNDYIKYVKDNGIFTFVEKYYVSGEITDKEMMDVIVTMWMKSSRFHFDLRDLDLSKGRGYIGSVRKDGTWKYIPYNHKQFIDIIRMLKKKLKIKSFLDVGSGYGDKVELAKRLNLESSGIEFDKEYVKRAKKFGVETICVNAFDFDGYKNFDLVYLYMPIQNSELYVKLVQNCLRKMKPNSYLIEVYACHLAANAARELSNELNLEITYISKDGTGRYINHDFLLIKKG